MGVNLEGPLDVHGIHQRKAKIKWVGRERRGAETTSRERLSWGLF